MCDFELNLYFEETIYAYIFEFGMWLNCNHFNKIIDQAKNKEYLPKRIHDGVVPLYIDIKYF